MTFDGYYCSLSTNNNFNLCILLQREIMHNNLNRNSIRKRKLRKVNTQNCFSNVKTEIRFIQTQSINTPFWDHFWLLTFSLGITASRELRNTCAQSLTPRRQTLPSLQAKKTFSGNRVVGISAVAHTFDSGPEDLYCTSPIGILLMPQNFVNSISVPREIWQKLSKKLPSTQLPCALLSRTIGPGVYQCCAIWIYLLRFQRALTFVSSRTCAFGSIDFWGALVRGARPIWYWRGLIQKSAVFWNCVNTILLWYAGKRPPGVPFTGIYKSMFTAVCERAPLFWGSRCVLQAGLQTSRHGAWGIAELTCSPLSNRRREGQPTARNLQSLAPSFAYVSPVPSPLLRCSKNALCRFLLTPIFVSDSRVVEYRSHHLGFAEQGSALAFWGNAGDRWTANRDQLVGVNWSCSSGDCSHVRLFKTLLCGFCAALTRYNSGIGEGLDASIWFYVWYPPTTWAFAIFVPPRPFWITRLKHRTAKAVPWFVLCKFCNCFRGKDLANDVTIVLAIRREPRCHWGVRGTRAKCYWRIRGPRSSCGWGVWGSRRRGTKPWSGFGEQVVLSTETGYGEAEQAMVHHRCWGPNTWAAGVTGRHLYKVWCRFWHDLLPVFHFFSCIITRSPKGVIPEALWGKLAFSAWAFAKLLRPKPQKMDVLAGFEKVVLLQGQELSNIHAIDGHGVICHCGECWESSSFWQKVYEENLLAAHKRTTWKMESRVFWQVAGGELPS